MMMTKEEKLSFNTWFIFKLLNFLINDGKWDDVKIINDALDIHSFDNLYNLQGLNIHVPHNSSIIPAMELILENYNEDKPCDNYKDGEYIPITIDNIGIHGVDSLDGEYDWFIIDIYIINQTNLNKITTK